MRKIALVSCINEGVGSEYALAGGELRDSRAFFGHGFQDMPWKHLHLLFIKHGASDAHGHVRLISPLRVILDTHLIAQLHPSLLIVFPDALMPFFKQSASGGAQDLIRFAKTQPACVDAANVGSRLQQDYGSTFTRSCDGRANAARCRAIDDNICGLCRAKGRKEGKEEDQVLHQIRLVDLISPCKSLACRGSLLVLKGFEINAKKPAGRMRTVDFGI